MSVIQPKKKPNIGPKHHPITISGTHAKEIVSVIPGIETLNKLKTILNEIKIAKIVNVFVDLVDRIGYKGKKNFFIVNFFLFFIWLLNIIS